MLYPRAHQLLDPQHAKESTQKLARRIAALSAIAEMQEQTSISNAQRTVALRMLLPILRAAAVAG